MCEREYSDLITTLMTRLGESENLEAVYSEQMEWARHFNQLIWTIASILVPVSLAGFALTFTDNAGNPQTATLITTALGSCGLILFWGLFAEWHRVLWQRAFTFTGTVEVFWRLRQRTTNPRELRQHMLVLMTPVDYGHWLRWGLVVAAFFGWGFKTLWAYPQPPSGVQFWSALALLFGGVVIGFCAVRSALSRPPR